MIARRWRVWTSEDRADSLGPYLRQTGIHDAVSTAGNTGSLLLRAVAHEDEVEFTLITFWESLDAVRRFAGEDYERAVLYPADRQFFTRADELVEHLEVAGHDGMF